MTDVALQAMRRLLFLPFLLATIGPANAQSTYLKCSLPLETGGEYLVWLTINSGQQFGTARTINLNGVELNIQANQLVSANQYILKTPASDGMEFTYTIDRTNGAFSRVIYFTGSGVKGNPQYGSCKKDAPAKTIF